MTVVTVTVVTVAVVTVVIVIYFREKKKLDTLTAHEMFSGQRFAILAMIFIIHSF